MQPIFAHDDGVHGLHKYSAYELIPQCVRAASLVPKKIALPSVNASNSEEKTVMVAR
jgi:hypothetical protein